MANDSITYALSGEVSLDQLATAAKDLAALIDALAGTIAFAAVARFKLRKVIVYQWRAFAKRWHVGPQVVDPDVLGIAHVGRATREEQDVRFDALRVENAGG